MKIILGGRASGKTTKLIQESAETGRRILTHNKKQQGQYGGKHRV